MIKIQIDDSIIDILDKIEKNNKEKVILSFPSGHPLLHNHLSLKIIRSKHKDKEVILQTSDKIGKSIAKKMGFQVVTNNKDSDIHHQNITRSEYFKYLLYGYLEDIKRTRYFKQARKSTKQLENKTLHFLLLIPLTAILTFTIIYYLAINKTNIQIYPEIRVKTQALNFTLKEGIPQDSILQNTNEIQLYTIEKKILSSQEYAATEVVISEDNIAKGTVTLFNYTVEAITLRPQTRFASESGLIFRTNEWISLPGGSIDNFGNIAPGSVEVKLSADSHDSSGKLTSERGNIPENTKLIIPGLGEASYESIYAINKEAFTGGKSEFKTLVSQEDIDTSFQLFEEKLKKNAYNEVLLEVEQMNQEEGKYRLLTLAESISYTQKNIRINEDVKAGDERDNFSLSGEITIKAYYYNSSDIISTLNQAMKDRSIDNIEKIKNIDSSSLRIAEVLQSSTNPLTVKATFEIKATSFYDLTAKSSTQGELELLKKKIAGMDISEAEKILINSPEIRKVEIQVRPFFIDSISKIVNNIEFEIEL